MRLYRNPLKKNPTLKIPQYVVKENVMLSSKKKKKKNYMAPKQETRLTSN